ncbi:hypothetical protein F5Y19DRAFT_484238 [Xylariaceae sp. FL1651]|nr:hypothetical protein F5Y19DRAFT_484238 [Xylariaceae sp. FL1651]
MPVVVRSLLQGYEQKACFSCTRAKRRCDKNLPSCRRCTEREELCKYPSVRLYVRAAAEQAEPELSANQAASVTTLRDNPLVSAPNSDMSWNDEVLLPFLDYCDTGEDSIVAHSTLNNSSWFLRGDIWTVHEYELEDFQPKIGLSHCKGYVKCVRRWLCQWVTENHCPFIHNQLYSETGLPHCLQDAYATLAAYIGKTEKNEEAVIQLVEDKTNRLLREQDQGHLFPMADTCGVSTPTPVVNMVQHIARVQALFIYQFICLFDGDIRCRARAERQTESVRRTWLVVNYTQSVYLTLRDGQTACPGSITYTLRTSLWEATSATEWCRLVNSCDPLLMRSDPPKSLYGIASSLEVDEFGLSIINIMWDSHRVDSWFAKSPSTTLQALLKL